MVCCARAGTAISMPMLNIVDLINNSIEELSPQKAMRYLFKETMRRIGKNKMNDSLNMINIILENCKFYKLKCNMDKSSAILSHDTIVKED